MVYLGATISKCANGMDYYLFSKLTMHLTMSTLMVRGNLHDNSYSFLQATSRKKVYLSSRMRSPQSLAATHVLCNESVARLN